MRIWILVNSLIIRVIRNIRGEILVFHDNPKIEARQKELLPQFIALIQEKKIKFQLLPVD